MTKTSNKKDKKQQKGKTQDKGNLKNVNDIISSTETVEDNIKTEQASENETITTDIPKIPTDSLVEELNGSATDEGMTTDDINSNEDADIEELISQPTDVLGLDEPEIVPSVNTIDVSVSEPAPKKTKPSRMFEYSWNGIRYN